MNDSTTATERLRALLNARGVEWRETVNYIGCVFTHYKSPYFGEIDAMDNDDGYLYFNELNRVCLTPEQAIAATLGSGTCEPKWVLQGATQTQEFWRCECGNCGYEFGVEDRSSSPFKMTIGKVELPNFCPNCGARVKAVGR